MPRRKSAASPASANRVPARRGRPPRAGSAVGAAAAAVSGLKAYHNALLAQRNDIDAKIAAVSDVLGQLGAGAAAAPAAPAVAAGVRRGRPAGGGSGRRPREGSLKAFITRVMPTGKVMSVKEITEEVMGAGYPTKNKTLAKSVGNILPSVPGVEKVGRGQFRRG